MRGGNPLNEERIHYVCFLDSVKGFSQTPLPEPWEPLQSHLHPPLADLEPVLSQEEREMKEEGRELACGGQHDGIMVTSGLDTGLGGTRMQPLQRLPLPRHSAST